MTSVPPEASTTQLVSSRRASAVATAVAAPGTQRSRRYQLTQPTRGAATRPSTRNEAISWSLR